MLKLTIRLSDSYNDETEEFVMEDFVLELEHSLVALSKWESKYEKPFLDSEEKTSEEVMGYIDAMIITPWYPSDILTKLTNAHIAEINRYIDAKMTATWFNEPKNQPKSSEKITSELIYYWMVSYQIPWEAENWHLNRLFTLIKIFNVKNSKPEKRTPGEVAASRRALNEARRKKYGTSG